MPDRMGLNEPRPTPTSSSGSVDQEDLRRVSGTRKAAALLIALGPELASGVLKGMGLEEIAAITREIVQMERLPVAVRDAILTAVRDDALSHEATTAGGTDYARGLLVRTFGTQKAGDLIARVSTSRPGEPFGFMRALDPDQARPLLEAEHPQTVAVVLAHMPPDFASRLLAGMGPDEQADIASRIATMGAINPETLREVEAGLEKQVAKIQTGASRPVGGVGYLVKVLGSMDSRSERAVMVAIEETDPELASQVREQMFVFADIEMLDDRSIQRLLRDVVHQDLVVALRGDIDALRDRILKNMSRRSAAALRDEIEAEGPVQLRLVEEARARITAIARALRDAEEIVVSRGEVDVVL